MVEIGRDKTKAPIKGLDTPDTREGPEEADRQRLSGKVRLRLRLEADGRVSDVDVVSATPAEQFEEFLTLPAYELLDRLAVPARGASPS